MKPPLSDASQPWAVVRFRHRDGETHTFYSAINEMTGNRLSAFDGSPPSINDPVAWVRTVIRDIVARDPDAEITGSIKPKR